MNTTTNRKPSVLRRTIAGLAAASAIAFGGVGTLSATEASAAGVRQQTYVVAPLAGAGAEHRDGQSEAPELSSPLVLHRVVHRSTGLSPEFSPAPGEAVDLSVERGSSAFRNETETCRKL